VISWRYHIVSIVAVVLAFGLGILAGTAVVNDEFVRTLRRNTNEAQRERDEARADSDVLERFAVQLRPTLRDDRLLGRDAVVVTMEGADRPAERVADELDAAGAEVAATVTLTTRLADPTAPDDLEALQRILGTTATDPRDVARRAADELAERLAVGAPVGREDLLARLLDDGFVTADRDLDPATLRDVGGVTTSVVIAAGSTAPDVEPPPGTLLLPVIERLVQLEARVAVAGPVEDRYGFVDAVREDPQVPDCSIVTVDDIDTVIGGIALVLGLERLALDPDPGYRPGGDYGVRAEALVPGGEPPSSCRE
jgi:hypothetical protein